MNYLQAAEYWREELSPDRRRVDELANRIDYLKKFVPGAVYGDTWIIEVVRKQLKSPPGAVLGLIEAGYLIPDEPPVWWKWVYPLHSARLAVE